MKNLFIIIYSQLLGCLRQLAILNPATFKLLYLPYLEDLRFFHGKLRRNAEFIKAKKRVPAYKILAAEHNDIPITSKENYVKRFSVAERCIDGVIPAKGVIIDESSGSSGMPMQWVRGQQERSTNFKFIEFGMSQLFGSQPKVLINAFAMGSWATGINVSMAIAQFSRVKSTGPDVDKIRNTLRYFGKEEQYIIMGYPPFLKYLIDSVELDLHLYNISMVMGGESMTEGLRDYLISRGIKSVYSSYGASDLELNIGFENDFTVEVRKFLLQNEKAQKDLFLDGLNLPMLFQFNPCDFYIETNDINELIISVCRPGYVAPKIRYNIRDTGQVIKKSELFKVLKKHNFPDELLKLCKADLPLLLVYGRADNTVSFFGSNISPLDIQEAIFQLPQISASVNSFCMEITEDADSNKHLEVHLESNMEQVNKEELNHVFFHKLTEINQDFKEAFRMLPKHQMPKLTFHKYGEGRFEDMDIRIKAQYIRRA